MARFKNKNTGVIISVDDAKDDRFAGEAWEAAPAPKTPAKRTAGKD